MSWQKQFNKGLKEVDENFYEFISKYMDICTIYFSEVEEELQQLLMECKYSGIKFENDFEKFKYGVMKLKEVNSEKLTRSKEFIDNLKNQSEKHVKDELVLMKMVFQSCIPYFNSNKEVNVCQKRLIYTMRMQDLKFQYFKDETIDDHLIYIREILNEISRYLMGLFQSILKVISENEYYLEKDKFISTGETLEAELESLKKNFELAVELKEGKDIEPEEKIIEKYDLKKIFNFKEMESLALANNYKYKWCSGDHLIYENIDSKRIIVIPAHTLTKELSYRIQKQIYKNKAI